MAAAKEMMWFLLLEEVCDDTMEHVTTWSCFRNWFEWRHLRSRHFSVSFMTRAADYTFCSRGKYQVSKHRAFSDQRLK